MASIGIVLLRPRYTRKKSLTYSSVSLSWRHFTLISHPPPSPLLPWVSLTLTPHCPSLSNPAPPLPNLCHSQSFWTQPPSIVNLLCLLHPYFTLSNSTLWSTLRGDTVPVIILNITQVCDVVISRQRNGRNKDNVSRFRKKLRRYWRHYYSCLLRCVSSLSSSSLYHLDVYVDCWGSLQHSFPTRSPAFSIEVAWLLRPRPVTKGSCWTWSSELQAISVAYDPLAACGILVREGCRSQRLQKIGLNQTTSPDNILPNEFDFLTCVQEQCDPRRLCSLRVVTSTYPILPRYLK